MIEMILVFISKIFKTSWCTAMIVPLYSVIPVVFDLTVKHSEGQGNSVAYFPQVHWDFELRIGDFEFAPLSISAAYVNCAHGELNPNTAHFARRHSRQF